MDLRLRRLTVQELIERGYVRLNTDFDIGDLTSLRVEEEDVGLPKLAADHISAPRRTHCGVSDLWVRDQDVAGVCWKIDDRRFAEGEYDRRRLRTAHAASADVHGGGVRRLDLSGRVRWRKSDGT